MLRTTEIRWFFEGSLHSNVLEWFCRRGHWLREAPREDLYLLLPGTDSVGVKLRQGRLEVKAATGPPSVLRLPLDASGISRSWVKWTSPSAVPERWADLLASEPGYWLPVVKERWLRRFLLENGRVVEPEPTSEYPLEGCSAEVGKVRAAGSSWWSLALEAFGPPSETDQILKAVATHFFHVSEPPRPLAVADSVSYPAWIRRLNPGP